MANGGIKRYNGSTWDQVDVKSYNGSFLSTVGKRYNGSTWDQIWPSVYITWPTSDILVKTADFTGAGPAGMRWETDGDTQKTSAGGSWGASDADDWLSNAGSGNGSDYELQWVKTGGATPDNTPGTEGAGNWHNLGTQRELSWDWGQFDRICVADVTIRKVGDASTEVTRQVTVEIDIL